MTPTIIYQTENDLTVEDFRLVLKNSTLGERRPIDDTERLDLMLKNANLIVTARVEGTIIGVSRAITDFAFCTYLSDWALDENYHTKGNGKALI